MLYADAVAAAMEEAARFNKVVGITIGEQGEVLERMIYSEPPKVPGGMTPDAWLKLVGRDMYVWPSGFVLPYALLPWVWRVIVPFPPFTDFVYGTAEQAAEYERKIKPHTILAEPAAYLNDLCVGVDEEGNQKLARALPAWTRHPDECGPSHEDWPGVPEGTKVWPMVPSGFEKDFAFRH